MAYNQTLITAIKDFKLDVNDISLEEYVLKTKALEEILNDSKERLTNNVFTHQVVWKKYGSDVTGNFDAHGSPTRDEIYEAAAKSYLFLKLTEASIQALSDIIASKKRFNTASQRSQSITGKLVGTLNLNITLTDDELTEIEDTAEKILLSKARKLLPELIQECNDEKVLKDLQDSDNYQEIFQKLLPISQKDYKFSSKSIPDKTMSRPHSQEFYNLVEEKIKKLEADNLTSGIQTKLKSIQKSQKVLEKNKTQLQPLLEVDPVRLINPTRHRATINPKLQGKFETRINFCQEVLSLLIQNKTALKIYQDKNKNEELAESINQEIENINAHLSFYKKIEGRCKAIIEEIKKPRMKEYEYVMEGVTTSGPYNSPTEIPTTQEARRNPVLPVQDNVQVLDYAGEVPAELEDFKLVDKLESGIIKVVTVTHHAAPADIGRFSIQINKARENTDNSTKRYEILDFPADEPGRVKMAMTMAIKILANRDTFPTKEKPLYLKGLKKDELRYVWTALMVLGEKTPGMKFGAEAIKLSKKAASVFDPEKEEKGHFSRYAFNSLHDKVFKQDPYKAEVKRHVENFREVYYEKFSFVEDAAKMKEALDKTKDYKKTLLKAQGKTPQALAAGVDNNNWSGSSMSSASDEDYESESELENSKLSQNIPPRKNTSSSSWEDYDSENELENLKPSQNIPPRKNASNSSWSDSEERVVDLDEQESQELLKPHNSSKGP